MYFLSEECQAHPKAIQFLPAFFFSRRGKLIFTYWKKAISAVVLIINMGTSVSNATHVSTSKTGNTQTALNHYLSLQVLCLRE